MSERPTSDRRKEILEAAARCLAQHGYAKTTMEDVGKEVGLNKASLYYYFKSKEALVSEVIAAELGEYIHGLRERVDQVSGCRDKITKYLVERFQGLQRVMNLHNLSVQDIRQVGPQLKQLYAAFKHQEQEFIASILRYCMDRGEIRECDAERVASGILTVAEGRKMEFLSSPNTPPDARVDYSGVVDDVVFTVTLMLQGLR